MWSVLCTDFDPEEETANFGVTRAALQSRGGELYDVVTFATLEPKGVPERPPKVVSRCNESQILALALEQCLHVIQPDSTADSTPHPSFSVIFAAPIHALAWSPCQRFVVAGLEAGRVQMVHVPTQMPLPPFDLGIEAEDKENERLQSHVCLECHATPSAKNGAMNLSVVLNTGWICKMKALDLDSLHKAILSQDMESMKSFQSQLAVEVLPLMDQELTQSLSSQEFRITASFEHLTKTDVGSLPMDYLDQAPSFVQQLKMSRVLRNVLFSLDNHGQMHMTCLHTLITLQVWSEEQVLDFVLIEDEGDLKIKILMFIQSMDKTGEYLLQMREHPSFELLYELPVSKVTHLIDCSMNQESPMFIEGTFIEGSDVISFLRMRGICESVLEARLHRLIRRNKFDEAFKFAHNFKLPVQDVHQAKISWLLEQLSPWRETTLDESEASLLLTDLKETLSKLTDLDFIVQCCINAALRNLNDVEELLKLARNIIQSNVGKEMNIQLMITVSRTLQRLETFNMALDGAGAEEWMAFLRADLFQMFLNSVRECKLEQSLIIWNRHKPEFSKSFDSEHVVMCLEMIPRTWSVEDRLHWLNYVLPDCLQMCPEALGEIASWAYRTTLVYEMESRREWPDNGLQFAGGILNTLCFSSDVDQETNLKAVKAQLVLNCQRSNPKSELSNLIGLNDLLKDLRTLHKRHRLRVKVQDFSSPDKMYVISLLLDWLTSQEEIQSLVETFLIEYITRFNLSPSDVFSTYLSELIRTTEFSWHWHFGETPWESKASALIPHIESIERRARVILEIAKCAPVPWSANIQRICDSGTSLAHPLSNEILEQSKMIGLKLILRKYDCRTLGLTGFRLIRLFQLMIKSKGEEGFKDALEITNFSVDAVEADSYRIYIKHLLIEGNDSKEALKVFKTLYGLQPEDCRKSAEILMNWAELLFTHRYSHFQESITSFLYGMIGVLELKMNSDLGTRVTKLKKRLQLFQEFQIKGTLTDPTPIRHYMEVKVTNNMTSRDLSQLYKEVLRLAELTDLGLGMLLKLLLEVLSKSAKSELAVQLALGLHQSSSRGGNQNFVSHIKSMILLMNSHLDGSENNDELPAILRKLAGSCLISCHPRDLAKVAYIARWQYFIERIQQQMHRNLSLAKLNQAQKILPGEKLVVFFRDKGLPLDKTIYTTIDACLQILDSDILSSVVAVKDLSSFGAKLCTQLHNMGHHDLSLALRLLIGDLLLQLAVQANDQDLVQTVIQGHVTSFQVKALLPKVLSEKRPDFILALTYLLGNAKAKSLMDLAHVNSNFGIEYNKLAALAQLGHEFSRLWNLVSPLENFQSLLVKATWGRFATDHGIQFKDCFAGGKSELTSMLKTFAIKPAISLENIVRYCRAFDINLSSSMVTYIRVSLANLEPTICKIQKKVMKPSNFDEVIERVERALCYLESGDECLALLSELFDEVNPYNYEVLGFVIEKLQYLPTIATVRDDKQCDMILRSSQCLGFLLQNNRVGELTETEIDKWYEHRNGTITPISQFRLPFTWLITLKSKEKFKILRNEFQLTNYSLWSKIANVLKLKTDTICMQTVQNAIGAISNSQEILDSDLEWKLHLKHDTTMTSIHACLSSMEDPVKATSCAHWVVNHLPGGADKLLAAEGSQLIAKNWFEETGEQAAEQGFVLATNTLLRLKVTNTLYKYGLNSKQYLDLATHGSGIDIIFKLFEDPSIVDRSKVAGGRFPDINLAAQEIADIYDENIQRIKYDLFDQWLPETHSQEDQANFDETITNFRLVFNKSDCGSRTSINEDNFHRCVYLAQGDNEEVLNYLLNKGFSKTRNVHTMHKFRSLKCLLAVGNESSIEACTSMKYEQVRTHMQNLYFLARLESLNLSYDEETFQEADKAALVESVLRSCSHNSNGILLLVELCIHFDIYPANLWISLLEHMEQLGMNAALTSVLLELNHQPHLWHFPAFASAWNSLILRPFQEAANPPVNEETVLKCEKSFNLISCCPIANSLDLETVRALCSRLQLQCLLTKYSFLFHHENRAGT
ncbi:hypothetical protein TCAL_00185 [Tigriopus californicus]|uniref:Uncharacterized protein n=1 Tax=Tigriopus californicus TaxID=6832 RepID=A0A553P4Z4_TIGCA|nr:kinetochore-associated protein 1-like [Tigriopus californicus]TRY72764.1 hypothetical protein TCAL_00185 [Tigriopus californicus]|eukprot:TCALIF_00185-PA protein Name:"Similar to Kntc1 Kinetochore-associated protein 1 (Mus musculus)" AED:0.00 eAED:0.00 QI:51/1/1/1/1/1/5/89/2025